MQADGNFVVYHQHLSNAKPLWASNTNGKGTAPYRLVAQNDGNLVIYDSDDSATWATGTNGKNEGGIDLWMQDDGNLVLYDGARKALWASKTVTEVKAGTNHGPDRVGAYERLYGGQSIKSSNGHFTAIVQDDGNFVVYKGSQALWASNTNGKGKGCSLEMQGDNNLVLYDHKGSAVWASGTNGKGTSPCYVVQQDDGNLVLYDSDNKALWASNTVQKQSSDTLARGETLPMDKPLHSQNGHYKLLVQEDGNLVLYKHEKHAIWASNTNGKGHKPHRLVNQNDGNLVLYDHHDKAHWASNTNRDNGNQRLVVQNDGNLVLYEGDKPLWASNTNGK